MPELGDRVSSVEKAMGAFCKVALGLGPSGGGLSPAALCVVTVVGEAAPSPCPFHCSSVTASPGASFSPLTHVVVGS